MELSTRSGLDHGSLDSETRRLLARACSPFVGLVRDLVYAAYDEGGPSAHTFLPDVPEFHRLAGIQTKPQYHLGGYGFTLREAARRAVGESIERSAHVLYVVEHRDTIRYSSLDAMREAEDCFVDPNSLAHFTHDQRNRPDFPFRYIRSDEMIGWAPMLDLNSRCQTWLPLQVLVTGYATHNEHRAVPAMTTGTASHLDISQSFQGALLELLQLDSAMGHWYSGRSASHLVLSEKDSPRIARLMQQNSCMLDRSGGRFEFYLLPNPDGVPMYSVACAYRSEQYPALALGLGASLDLERAIYSSLYETIPIAMIALMEAVRVLFDFPEDGEVKRKFTNLKAAYANFDGAKVSDLETAVGANAMPDRAESLFPARFDPENTVDFCDADRGTVGFSQLLAAVLEKHKLYAMDLGFSDAARLGFRVTRLYSPTLIPLCFPSFPEEAHPRFAVYGGVNNTAPHPYP